MFNNIRRTHAGIEYSRKASGYAEFWVSGTVEAQASSAAYI